MINHRYSSSLNILNSISQYKVLASEWFGVIEFEQEGIFCAFVDRIHNANGKKDYVRMKCTPDSRH